MVAPFNPQVNWQKSKTHHFQREREREREREIHVARSLKCCSVINDLCFSSKLKDRVQKLNHDLIERTFNFPHPNIAADKERKTWPVKSCKFTKKIDRFTWFIQRVQLKRKIYGRIKVSKLAKTREKKDKFLAHEAGRTSKCGCQFGLLWPSMAMTYSSEGGEKITVKIISEVSFFTLESP